jgi:hypothetical protein
MLKDWFGLHLSLLVHRFTADQVPPEELQESTGYDLYARFRPQVSKGTAGWGQKSQFRLSTVLDLRDEVRHASRQRSTSMEEGVERMSHSAAESK